MRRRRVRTAFIAWLTVLAFAWTAAAEVPDAVANALAAGDADVLVTDARGVIVGVGRLVAGASFELRVLEGFVGPARLTLLRPDGTTEVLEVMVGHHVLVHGLDLVDLLAERFETFIVEVGGVTYHEAERRGPDAGDAAGEGPRNAEPPSPADSPSPADPPRPPGSPGSPGASPPRGPEGRP
jgi:hypothetical protein